MIFYFDHKDKKVTIVIYLVIEIQLLLYSYLYFHTDYPEYFGKLDAIRNNLYGTKVLFTGLARSTDDYKISFALEIV